MNAPVFNILKKVFAVMTTAFLPVFLAAQVQIDAVDDIAHTYTNQPITIDVLRNDFSASGNLRLDKVVLENNGKATVENGKIVFTPNAEYKGAAMLNYTVCDDTRNICATGLVYVDIAEKPHLDYQEMKIFTLERTSTKFTLPLGFKLTMDAFDGSVVPVNSNGQNNNGEPSGEWMYIPNSNFKGVDRCSFSIEEDGNEKLFDVEFEVLGKQLEYIVPDLASTRIGKPVRFNVLNNDNTSGITSITFGECIGGSIETSTDGWVTLTPNLPDGGRATFTYTVTIRLPSNEIKTETTQVVVFVSEYLPSKDQFRLTSAGVPLAIQYPSPLEGYRFEVLNENTPELGFVKFFSYIDTIVRNIPIKGTNILLYVPRENLDRETTDRFFVKYCVENKCSDNIEVLVDLIDPGSGDQCAGKNCVWPGDTNGDGEVNILDLYPIAYSIGQYGALREKDRDYPETRTTWYAHTGESWGKTTFNGFDMKHADTNGDGVVSIEDVEAIEENYSQYSTITPIKTVQDDAIEVRLISTAAAARTGDLLEMLVYVGSARKPAFDAKGLNFAVKYDARLIKENSIKADFSAYNWLSRYDAYIPFNKIAERGQLHAGLARSRGKGTNGHGEVGKVRAIVEDNISGIRGDEKTSIKFRLENVTMIGANGHPIALPSAELEIPLELGKKAEPLKNDDLVMYPNPANEMINFHINGVNNIDYVRILDATGREVTRLNKVNAKSASIPVGAAMRGFYIAEVMTEKGRIIKKLEIIK